MKEKRCPRCKKQFKCLVEDIENCDCRKIALSKELKFFLSKTSYNCLCNECLDELKTLTSQASKEQLPISKNNYIDGKHFYIENNLLVFTEYFHIVKGTCCRNACRHCAYGFNS